MKEKYKALGLDYDLIISKYPNIDEYEEIVNSYLDDEFFSTLKDMLNDEDYELAKDAVKGLYVLAGELCLFPIYEALLEVYEDLEFETYEDVLKHCDEVIKVHKKIRGGFCA